MLDVNKIVQQRSPPIQEQIWKMEALKGEALEKCKSV